ncbi:potassium channel family protein [Garciella nitratireducens]|uniref:Voltage-gated potassium channel n=1 Tax=Garciella nitratireducens DSM 15102 TaxID=1121911 RepID=A0A1T4MBB9_9FIRM|nr:potassium channel protein [Garciella nitratireducens]SJZ64205.1 voltage-gated potassium channel [Garciella nitratireducens DSM 15102]
MNEKQRMKMIFFIFIILLVIGTIGYSELLQISLPDSLYITLMNILGYSEVKGMPPIAKIFSMIVLTFGVGIGGYTVGIFIDIMMEGKMKDSWRKKILENKISKLKDHYILCGAGETGEVVVGEFIQKHANFVVIERNENVYKKLIEDGILAILGDATEEEILDRAQIKKAKGLISSLSKDADNIVAVLTARQMNTNMYIIARAIDKTAHSKLKKAGANCTISPNEIGGRRMAAQIINPSIISFLDVITRIEDIELDLEGIVIQKNSSIIGKPLKEIRMSGTTGLIVLAIQKYKQEDILFNPSPDEILNYGDVLLILATDSQIKRIKKLANEI